MYVDKNGDGLLSHKGNNEGFDVEPIGINWGLPTLLYHESTVSSIKKMPKLVVSEHETRM